MKGLLFEQGNSLYFRIMLENLHKSMVVIWKGFSDLKTYTCIGIWNLCYFLSICLHNLIDSNWNTVKEDIKYTVFSVKSTRVILNNYSKLYIENIFPVNHRLIYLFLQMVSPCVIKSSYEILRPVHLGSSSHISSTLLIEGSLYEAPFADPLRA